MQKNITGYLKKLLKLKGKKNNIHLIIITIAMVMIWRGVWGILDKFLFPQHELISYIIGIIIGIGILFLDDQKLDELGHH